MREHQETQSVPTRRRLLVGAGATVVAALLSACSSSKGGGTSTSPSPAPATTAPSTGAPSTAASASASAARSSSPSAAPSASTSAASAAVTIKDFAFNPASLTVAPGAKITVTNQDSASHTLTSSSGGGFDTGTLATGKSATITAPVQPGSYPFVCRIHPSMKGTLVVS